MCQPKGLRDIFQGGGTGSADIWVKNAGADPPHGRALVVFQYGVARGVPGRHLKRREEGGWE